MILPNLESEEEGVLPLLHSNTMLMLSAIMIQIPFYHKMRVLFGPVVLWLPEYSETICRFFPL